MDLVKVSKWLGIGLVAAGIAGCGGSMQMTGDGGTTGGADTITVSGILLDPDTIQPAVGAYVYIKDVYPRVSSNMIGADGKYTIQVPKNLGDVNLVADDAEPNSGKEWYPTIDGHTLTIGATDITGLLTHICPKDVLQPVLERTVGVPQGWFVKVGFAFGPVLSGTPPNVTPIADVAVTQTTPSGMMNTKLMFYPAWVYNKSRMFGTANAALVIPPTNECEVWMMSGCTETCMDMTKPETCKIMGTPLNRTTTNEGGIWAAVNADGSMTGINTFNWTYKGTTSPAPMFEKDVKSPIVPGFATFVLTLSQ